MLNPLKNKYSNSKLRCFVKDSGKLGPFVLSVVVDSLIGWPIFDVSALMPADH